MIKKYPTACQNSPPISQHTSASVCIRQHKKKPTALKRALPSVESSVIYFLYMSIINCAVFLSVEGTLPYISDIWFFSPLLCPASLRVEKAQSNVERAWHKKQTKKGLLGVRSFNTRVVSVRACCVCVRACVWDSPVGASLRP